MKDFRFDQFYDDPLHCYRLVTQGFFETGIGLIFREQPYDFKPWIYSSQHSPEFDRADIALYNGFIWRLAEGLEGFGTPHCRADGAHIRSGIDFSPINWEYQIKYDGLKTAQMTDVGFVRVRKWMKRISGLFRIRSFEDLINIQDADDEGPRSEVNLYYLQGGRERDLLNALQSNTRPKLENILNDGEFFVDLGLGIDWREHTILIKSRQDMSIKIEHLESEYGSAIKSYKSVIERLADTDGGIAALKKLARGEIQD